VSDDMKILAKKKHKNTDFGTMALPSKVRELGKHLANNLEGVYKVKEPQNQYEVYTTILYMIKPETRKAMKEYPEELKGIEDDIYEMNIYLNITTYGQYIRVNVIVDDDNKETLGYLRLEPEELTNKQHCQDKIVNYVKKRIESKFTNYEVLI
jgi:uncharacterized protein with NRDE domain